MGWIRSYSDTFGSSRNSPTTFSAQSCLVAAVKIWPSLSLYLKGCLSNGTYTDLCCPKLTSRSSIWNSSGPSISQQLSTWWIQQHRLSVNDLQESDFHQFIIWYYSLTGWYEHTSPSGSFTSYMLQLLLWVLATGNFHRLVTKSHAIVSVPD